MTDDGTPTLLGAFSLRFTPPISPPAGCAWEPLRPGVEVAWLYRDEPDGPRAALLRYQPGASVPEHEHAGYEHIYVLEGGQRDEQAHYPAGTMTVFPPGTRHRITSEEGCVVLAVWTRPIRFIEG